MNSNIYNYHLKAEIKLGSIIAVAFFLLLLITSLNNVSSSISIIGFLALAILLGGANFLLIYYLTKSSRVATVHIMLLVVSLAYLLILLVGLLNNLTSRGMVISVQFISSIGFCIFLSLVRWDKDKVKKLGFYTVLFILIHFFIWVSQGFKPFFASIYNNSNLIGPYMLYSMFFIFWMKMYSKNKILLNIIILICLFIMYGSNTRSVMFAGIVGIITFIIWRFITKNKFRFMSYFLVIYSFIISFPFLYSQLPNWKYYSYFEQLMLEYTEKSLMSGRQLIWNPIISMASKSPILGYGTGISTEQVIGVSKSTHNLYLNIVMQNGYLGLLIFSIILLSIWLIFWKAHNSKTVKLVAAFFIVTIVYQSFELTFTQNQLSVGLIQWFIISIGISEYLHSNKVDKLIS